MIASVHYQRHGYMTSSALLVVSSSLWFLYLTWQWRHQHALLLSFTTGRWLWHTGLMYGNDFQYCVFFQKYYWHLSEVFKRSGALHRTKQVDSASQCLCVSQSILSGIVLQSTHPCIVVMSSHGFATGSDNLLVFSLTYYLHFTKCSLNASKTFDPDHNEQAIK